MSHLEVGGDRLLEEVINECCGECRAHGNQNWTSAAVEIMGLRSVGVDNFLGRITQFSGGTGGDQSSPIENTRGDMES